MSGYFTVNNFKSYGQARGINDDQYFALLGAVAAFCSSIRFIWSTLTDYFSYKTVYGILVSIQVVLDCTIPFVASSKGLFAIWVSLILFTEGGHFTLLPNVVNKIYGDKGTSLYGFAYSYTGIAALLILFS